MIFEYVGMPSVVKNYYEKYQFEDHALTIMSKSTAEPIDSRIETKMKLVCSQLNSLLRNFKKIQQHCVICLDTIDRRCFADKCLHSFCTRCLVRWSDRQNTCPICGQQFGAIFYNVRSIRSYKIRKLRFAADQELPCLVRRMKNVSSFHHVNENVSRILKKYKLTVNVFCNVAPFLR